MGVLLGESGQVELRRTGLDEVLRGTVARSDVNYLKDRFSFNFPLGSLLTGDQVEIRTADGSLLDFIAPSGWPTNTRYKDGIFYLYVDEVGAIRLYRRFDEAISGERTGRVNLVDPNRSVDIELRVRNNNERILGQVISFELNTERDAVDVTALTDEFRRNASGLISGSGRIECFFDYERRDCDPMVNGVSAGVLEMPIYMNQLLIRTKIGSEFWSKLTLVRRGPKPYGTREDYDDEVWYEFDARITNVGMEFSSGEPIRTTIEFVTTGEIKLRTRYIGNYLLAEQGAGDRIRLEENQSGFIEVEQHE
jgi:hypothetical protein